MFDHTTEGKKIVKEILAIKRGRQQVAKYAMGFCMLTAGSGWNEPALKAAFCNRLNMDVLMELASQDKQVSLDSLIDLMIHLTNLCWNCQVY